MTLKPVHLSRKRSVKKGTKLRIPGIGDSINLKNDLSADEVVFVGTEAAYGTMDTNYFSGKTIIYIANYVRPSLQQRPNIVLLHAGTNDMNPSRAISTEGNDPNGAAERLGGLIDQIMKVCPDATVLVAMPISTCDQAQQPATVVFQSLIPGIVQQRRAAGNKGIAVDFTSFSMGLLRDRIHPTQEGYRVFGDFWYEFIEQIPSEWIEAPIGLDPDRPSVIIDLSANGSLDLNVPSPDWGTDPISVNSKSAVSDAASIAGFAGTRICDAFPHWQGTGNIALGLGRTRDWKYHKNWIQPGPNNLAPSKGTLGKAADGLHENPRFADYLWIHPTTGTNSGIIASGAGPARSVYFADLNGDGKDDYLVVNPNNGAVDVYWNYGPDSSWENGWKFVPAGQIASGVPHANLGTLRFPDINGDGRADYVYIGAGGSLGHWLNTGSKGGQDVLFNPSSIKLADLDGDGKDDFAYIDNERAIWLWWNRGAADSTMAIDGIRFADIDGDGLDDYTWVDPVSVAPLAYLNKGPNRDDVLGWLWLPLNDGKPIALGASAGSNIHFGDVDGDGKADYLVTDPRTGEPTAYLNGGPAPETPESWKWKPIESTATGLGPGKHVRFADIDGDGYVDYIFLRPNSGTTIYRNVYDENHLDKSWTPMPDADASGIGERPEEISFMTSTGKDGKADYIWTRPHDGKAFVHIDQYPRQPTWGS
ncbi:carbohydrate esterase family 3 protein [Glonium stellatum]|uniref:Carbohydrate esterase family 3 protein n=1 Tax=Glonium stellatum TaxID=574774 RepID=A0A8E2JM85_9PEZI|nr:carbohydrate esterase family 3 protein [Glonium stellatum]